MWKWASSLKNTSASRGRTSRSDSQAVWRALKSRSVSCCITAILYGWKRSSSWRIRLTVWFEIRTADACLGVLTLFARWVVIMELPLKSKPPRRTLVPPSTNVWQSLTQGETKLWDVSFPMIPTPPFSHHLKALGAKFKSASNCTASCTSLSYNSSPLKVREIVGSPPFETLAFLSYFISKIL